MLFPPNISKQTRRILSVLASRIFSQRAQIFFSIVAELFLSMNFCFFLLNSQVPSRHLAGGAPDRGKIIVVLNVGSSIKMTENDQIGPCCFAYLVLPVMSCQFLGSLFSIFVLSLSMRRAGLSEIIKTASETRGEQF